MDARAEVLILICVGERVSIVLPVQQQVSRT